MTFHPKGLWCVAALAACGNKGSSTGSGTSGQGNLQQPVEILLEAQNLPLNFQSVGTMAVGRGARKVYLGAYGSQDSQQRNLAVLSLDSAGQVTNTRLYPESPGSFFTTGRTNVNAILLDETNSRLYLANNYPDNALPKPDAGIPLVTVYAIDSDGLPIPGSARALTSWKGANEAFALARHARLNRLYIGGVNYIWQYQLNDAGDETSSTGDFLVNAPIAATYYDLAVVETDASATLYASAVAAPGRSIQVWPLTADGGVPSQFPSFSAIEPDGGPTWPGTGCTEVGFIQLIRATPDAIYLRPPWVVGRPDLSRYCPLGIWRIDSQQTSATRGQLATASPEFALDVGTADVAFDSTRALLWITTPSLSQTDVFTGSAFTEGVDPQAWSVDATSRAPSLRASSGPVGQNQKPLRMEISSDGKPVVLTTSAPTSGIANITRGWSVRARLLEGKLDGGALSGMVPLTLYVMGKYVFVPKNGNGFFPFTFDGGGSAGPLGDWTDWQSLDAVLVAGSTSSDAGADAGSSATQPFLKDNTSYAVIGVTANDIPFSYDFGASGIPQNNYSDMKYEFEVMEGASTSTPAPATKRLTQITQGAVSLYVVPGYAFKPGAHPAPQTLDEATRSLTEHTKMYSDYADSVAGHGVSGGLPEQIVITCGSFDGRQGSEDQLRSMANAVRKLGCNTVSVGSWGNISNASFQQILASQGISGYQAGGYRIGQSGTYGSGCDASVNTYGAANFDFEYATSEPLDCWAKAMRWSVQTNSKGDENRVRVVQLSDEPLFGLVDPPPCDAGNAPAYPPVPQEGAPAAGACPNPKPDAGDSIFSQCTAGRTQGLTTLANCAAESPTSVICGTACYDVTNSRCCPPWSATFSTSFASYLQGKGLTASYFDAGALTSVRAVVASRARLVANPSDRLHAKRAALWTSRYFVEAAAKMTARAKQSLAQVFPDPKLAAFVNWNNWAYGGLAEWYMLGLNNLYDSIDYDWFENGRQGGSALWTEDHVSSPDSKSHWWSFYANVLRSAAAVSDAGVGFGSHVVAGYIGWSGVPEGASYKMLSLIGHGAKTISLYQFGPGLFGITDSWSEGFPAYAPLARAAQRMGAADALLYAGKPPRGNIAVQMPSLSSLWKPRTSQAYYDYEPFYLHYALMHAGYAVDMVDDYDLAANVIARKYLVVYLTQPNLLTTAAAPLRSWVADGGTLALLPGAATRDEFDETTTPSGQPTVSFDDLLGVDAGSRRQVADSTVMGSNYNTYTLPSGGQPVAYTTRWLPSDDRRRPVFGAFIPPVALFGYDADLDAGTRCLPSGLYDPAWGAGLPVDDDAGATVLSWATVRVPTGVAASCPATSTTTVQVPAIVAKTAGNGAVVAYGFFPGFEYYATADNNKNRGLPTGFDADKRTVATFPAENVPLQVYLSNPTGQTAGVEALRLDSAQGTAVILLNWFATPISMLDVTVPNIAGSVSAVSSIETGATGRVSQGTATITLSTLNAVDIIKIE